MAVNDHGIPHHKSGLGAAFTGKKVASDHPGNIARDGAKKVHADVAVAWGQHRNLDGTITSLHGIAPSATETVVSGAGPTPLDPVVSKNLSAPKLSPGMKSQTTPNLTDDVHRQLAQTILKFAKGN